MRKQYAVLGLGIFGSTVAKTLSSYNCEVIAMDSDLECVQRVSDFVSVAVQADITDIHALQDAGVGECDIAIVATGELLEVSTTCVMHLKELGVPHVIAKAKNKTYKKILEKVGADRVVQPEKEFGIQIAKAALNPNALNVTDIDREYSVVELVVPDNWYGKNLIELDVRAKYGYNILAIRHENGKMRIQDIATYTFKQGDAVLTIMDTDSKDFGNFQLK